MVNKFNKRELAFIYWRARGENLVNSVIKAGYKAKTRLVASSYGWKLEKKVDILEAIQREKVNIFDKSMVTEEYVLNNLKQLAETSHNEADKIRANELLGKYLAMFTDKTENTNIDKQDNQFSLERLSRLKQLPSES